MCSFSTLVKSCSSSVVLAEEVVEGFLNCVLSHSAIANLCQHELSLLLGQIGSLQKCVRSDLLWDDNAMLLNLLSRVTEFRGKGHQGLLWPSGQLVEEAVNGLRALHAVIVLETPVK